MKQNEHAQPHYEIHYTTIRQFPRRVGLLPEGLDHSMVDPEQHSDPATMCMLYVLALNVRTYYMLYVLALNVRNYCVSYGL